MEAIILQIINYILIVLSAIFLKVLKKITLKINWMLNIHNSNFNNKKQFNINIQHQS